MERTSPTALCLLLSAGVCLSGQALGAQPPEPLMRVSRAWQMLESGQIDAARRELEAALEQAPDSTAAHYVLGTLHERTGELLAAVGAYRMALLYDPRMAEAHDLLVYYGAADVNVGVTRVNRAALLASLEAAIDSGEGASPR
jgi:Tfp pilus assembly protein PilF